MGVLSLAEGKHVFVSDSEDSERGRNMHDVTPIYDVKTSRYARLMTVYTEV